MIHIISMAVQGGTHIVVGDKTRKGLRKLETFIPLYYSRKRVAAVLRELADKLEKV